MSNKRTSGLYHGSNPDQDHIGQPEHGDDLHFLEWTLGTWTA